MMFSMKGPTPLRKACANLVQSKCSSYSLHRAPETCLTWIKMLTKGRMPMRPTYRKAVDTKKIRAGVLTCTAALLSPLLHMHIRAGHRPARHRSRELLCALHLPCPGHLPRPQHRVVVNDSGMPLPAAGELSRKAVVVKQQDW